jgi:hypothetical protein
MDFNESGCDGVDWVYVAPDMDQWRESSWERGNEPSGCIRFWEYLSKYKVSDPLRQLIPQRSVRMPTAPKYSFRRLRRSSLHQLKVKINSDCIAYFCNNLQRQTWHDSKGDINSHDIIFWGMVQIHASCLHCCKVKCYVNTLQNRLKKQLRFAAENIRQQALWPIYIVTDN